MREVEKDVLDSAARIRELEDALKSVSKRLGLIEGRHEKQKRAARGLRSKLRNAQERAAWAGARAQVQGERERRARERANLFLESAQIYQAEGIRHGWDISDGVNQKLWSIRRRIEALDRAASQCVCVPARADALR